MEQRQPRVLLKDVSNLQVGMQGSHHPQTTYTTPDQEIIVSAVPLTETLEQVVRVSAENSDQVREPVEKFYNQEDIT